LGIRQNRENRAPGVSLSIEGRFGNVVFDSGTTFLTIPKKKPRLLIDLYVNGRYHYSQGPTPTKENTMKNHVTVARETKQNRFQAVQIQSRLCGQTVFHWEVIDTAEDSVCGFGSRRFCINLAQQLESESVADRDAV
jgi:ribosomal protein L37E